MKPKFLGGAEPDVVGKDRREVLSKWLASPDNPYFATNLANIVWAHFFGIGIIHDVDDVRDRDAAGLERDFLNGRLVVREPFAAAPAQHVRDRHAVQIHVKIGPPTAVNRH